LREFLKEELAPYPGRDKLVARMVIAAKPHHYAPRMRDAVKLFAPWAMVAVVLYVIGVWIILQPMEMRGLAALILPT